MTTDLAERDATGLAEPALDQMQRLQLAALDKGPEGVAMMRELLAMQRELAAEQAKRDWAAALAAFQATQPPIEPDAKGAHKQPYCTFDNIMSTIAPALAVQGLSVSFDSEDCDDSSTRLVCYVHHANGHTERRTARVSKEPDSKRMNITQADGSALTYGQRYVLRLALSLRTGETDDDGRASGQSETVTQEQADRLRALADDVFVPAQFARFLADYGTDTWAGIPAARYADADARLATRRKYLEEHPDAMEAFESAKREAIA